MDKALKQRLVGASVIIALAVVVLPMLLNGRPEGGSPESQKIELPPRPGELSFETRRFPVSESQSESGMESHGNAAPVGLRPPVAVELPAETAAPPVKDAQTEAASLQDPAAEQGVTAQIERPALDFTQDSIPQSAASVESAKFTVEGKFAETADGTVDETVQEPASEIAKTIVVEPLSAGRYLVQVASLGSSENAASLMKSLQQMGFPVVMDAVDSDVGRLNRIRVGPYPSEAEAAYASAQIGKEFEGVNPRVIDLEPEQTAAVTNPADPLVRWVVQIGSFAETGNAQRLVEQLRVDGMPAYRDQVTSASSSVYRVRVGPFLEREEALRTRQQLSERFSIDGVVMSAD